MIDGWRRQRRETRTSVSCVINNFNYGLFVVEAVQSALDQSVAFDEVVVVDDGSTDESLSLLERHFGNESRIKLLVQANRGQLGAINVGYQASRGDLVCFLDADDLYRPQYLEQVLAAYRADPGRDFVFCGAEMFGNCEGEMLRGKVDQDWGLTRELTRRRRLWIGNPTSCLSVRRRCLERFLPLPLEEDWRIRADDCLVFGASLAGAHKFYLAQPLVGYRVHGGNGFFGLARNRRSKRQHRRRVDRLFRYLDDSLTPPRQSDAQPLSAIHSEFLTHPQPSLRVLIRYAKLTLLSKAPWRRRAAGLAPLWSHYLSCGRQAAPLRNL